MKDKGKQGGQNKNLSEQKDQTALKAASKSGTKSTMKPLKSGRGKS